MHKTPFYKSSHIFTIGSLICCYNIFFITGSFPHIVNPPSDQVINLEANDHNISLLCETDRRLFITWEKENDTIALDRANGINSGNLTLISLQPEDAGNYRCVVRGSFYGSCSSDYATITINGNYIST